MLYNECYNCYEISSNNNNISSRVLSASWNQLGFFKICMCRHWCQFEDVCRIKYSLRNTTICNDRYSPRCLFPRYCPPPWTITWMRVARPYSTQISTLYATWYKKHLIIQHILKLYIFIIFSRAYIWILNGSWFVDLKMTSRGSNPGIYWWI